MKKLILVISICFGFLLNSSAQILTLQSKVDVTLNVVSLNTGKVKMHVQSEERNALAITVSGTYVEAESGDVIKSFSFTVPNEMANQLGMVPIPNGATLIEARNTQLISGILSVLQEEQDFGLKANQWEIYVAPPPAEE